MTNKLGAIAISTIAGLLYISSTFQETAHCQEILQRKDLDIENWSYEIYVFGNTVGSKCEDLRKFVGEDEKNWLVGLRDKRSLDSLSMAEAGEGKHSRQAGPNMDYRVCDLFYLEYIVLHANMDGPRASEFKDLKDRDARITKLVELLTKVKKH